MGSSLETFDKDALYEYVTSKELEYSNKIEPGITFFMCMPRIALLEMGGMDNLFNPMFCEDDDLIRRWKMLGMNCFTALDAICYHFVSKTSRFSEEYQTRTQQIELASNRNYLRKWGTKSNAPKYDIAIRVTGCNMQLLELLEPHCNRIFIDDEMEVLFAYYYETEQPTTKFDLKSRINTQGWDNPNDYHDIVVECNKNSFGQLEYQYITQLPEIVNQSGEVGTFRLGNLTITIHSMITYEKNLIKLI